MDHQLDMAVVVAAVVDTEAAGVVLLSEHEITVRAEEVAEEDALLDHRVAEGEAVTMVVEVC